MLDCAECKTGDVVCVEGVRWYPSRPDLHDKHVWVCQQCGAYVGCHKGTTTPLGTTAGPETRRARALAHAVFDRIWRNGQMSRAGAYKWMGQTLGLTPAESHIGCMDVATCRRLINAVARFSST